MFTKLIKYESKELWKSLRAVWGAALLAYTLAVLGLLFKNQILDGLSMFTIVIAIIAISAGATIIIAVRYYRTMAGQEAYFTHTIPLSGGRVFAAKFIVAYIAQILALLLLIPLLYFLIRFSVALSMPGLPLGVAFSVSGQVLRENINLSWGFLTWVIILTFILFSVFSMLIAIFFSVAKGSEARFHHLGVGGPIVVYLILYGVQQVLGFLALLFVPLGISFNMQEGQLPQFRLVFESSLKNLDILTASSAPQSATVGIGMFPLFILASFILMILTIRSHCHKTSVR